MDDTTEDSLAGEDPLDQILAEYLQAAESDDLTAQPAFLDRYPEHAAELREFFAHQERFERAAAPFRFDATKTQDSRASYSSIQGPSLDVTENKLTESPGVDIAAPVETIAGERIRYFGEYELLGEIARGGMGVVFKARQVRLNRIVALKMILAGQFASAQDVKRFHVEAHNAAQLDHPNIVPVYEVGKHKGQHYFTMKLVEGASLSRRAGEYTKNHKSAVRLLATAARAVDYAHQRGILHRDIKPGNILVDSSGQPQVTDFGLARRLEGRDEGESLTLTGAIVGSPSYMSPEQARGEKGLTVAADIYALGAVLYELLTGKPPFSGASALAVLEQVRQDTPERPLSINATLGRDLEVVCLKCLDKDPLRRYTSARALAEDLEQWLRGEPISARPVGAPERILRWCRRKPALATAAGLAFSATVAALFILTIAVVLLGRSRDQKDAFALKEQAQRARADDNARDARGRLAIGLVFAGQSLLNAQRGAEGRRSFEEAWAIAQADGLPEFPMVAGLVQSYASSPPPLLGEGRDPGGPPFLHAERVEGVAMSPDGRSALAASGKCLWLWDLVTGQLVRSFAGHRSAVLAVAWTPDGRCALSGDEDGEVRYWDLTAGTSRVLAGHERKITCVALSSDGRTGASTSFDGRCIFWDLDAGKSRAQYAPRRGFTLAVAFSPDGGRALVSVGNGTIVLLDARTGGVVGEFAGIPGHDAWVFALAFSEDGQTALSGGEDNVLRLWDVNDGSVIRASAGHTGTIHGVAFLPGGAAALSVSDDWTLRLWNLKTGEARRVFSGHADVVRGLAISGNGRLAVTGSADGTLKVWDLTGGNDRATFAGHEDSVESVIFMPDGLTALSASVGRDPTVRRWDVATCREVGAFAAGSRALAVSADGRRMLCASADGTVRLLDLPTGRMRQTLRSHRTLVNAAAFSPDGKLGASVASVEGELRLWDLTTGTLVLGFVGRHGSVRGVVFSPDGTLIATAGYDHLLKLWDVASGNLVRTFAGHDAQLNGIAFAPDGRTLISGSSDQTLRLWDVASGRSLRVFKGHWAAVLDVAFAPDGRTVASASSDETVRLWDAATGLEIARFSGHVGAARCVAFSPNGHSLLSGGADQTVRRWNLDRPARYKALETKLVKARAVLSRLPDDPASLATLGEWYAFRGVDDWAAGLLERARRDGAEVSSLVLARCYWRLKKPAEAEREFRTAADGSVEADSYLGLCIAGQRKHDAVFTMDTTKPSPDNVQSPTSESAAQRLARHIPLNADIPRITQTIEQARLKKDASLPRLLETRALPNARSGHFKEAAADYAEILRLEPGRVNLNRERYACLLAYLNDTNGYRDLGRTLVKSPPDWKISDQNCAARCLLLLPLEPGDDGRLALLWVDGALARFPSNRWLKMTQAIAEYRAGHVQVALNDFIAVRPELPPVSRAGADCFIAMAKWRLGDEAESAILLTRIIATIDSELPQAGRDDLSTTFQEWLVCQVVRREAEALIGVDRPATRP